MFGFFNALYLNLMFSGAEENVLKTDLKAACVAASRSCYIKLYVFIFLRLIRLHRIESPARDGFASAF